MDILSPLLVHYNNGLLYILLIYNASVWKFTISTIDVQNYTFL
jgi:hypothetical protein